MSMWVGAERYAFMRRLLVFTGEKAVSNRRPTTLLSSCFRITSLMGRGFTCSPTGRHFPPPDANVMHERGYSMRALVRPGAVRAPRPPLGRHSKGPQATAQRIEV
jgi:hypothetical protein